LREALDLLDPDDPSIRPIAGGTALMLMMKSGLFRPKRLVCLNSLGEDFTRIDLSPSGELRIGAMVRLSDLERALRRCQAFPVITAALRTHSNPRVRNVATVGGNLAHADPHMDLPPVLMALGAQVDVVGPGGQRSLAIDDLLAGYYETALAGNELITALTIPAQPNRPAMYVKCTTRAADDWPALGIAVSLEVHEMTITMANVVVSAATEKATRLVTTERLLAGRAIEPSLPHEAGRTAAEEAPIVADERGSASYKRQLLDVYLRRVLVALLELPPSVGAVS